MEDLDNNLERARDMIPALHSTLVAYSGGVDSTLLLALCLEVLGTENVLAVTARSPTYSEREWREIQHMAGVLGARHRMVDSAEMDDPHFASHPPGRWSC